ncbi:MAG: hypothetical protein LBN22_07005 [Clostridiales Family XIII bacterium]|jgi:hypothetical protein|nr:hypothetical protein [Clostridiales Family XIII bacterium]
MTLYETIFQRRSVRAYDSAPLDGELIQDIEQYLNSIVQMSAQSATFKITSGDEVKGTAAPHCILACCKSVDAEYANVGYVLQKMDLYLQSMGLGSLWLGMAKPKEKLDDFCILLAFGNTTAPKRTSESDFKRLKLSEISDTDNAVSRAVHIAPSAMNSQPWKLKFADGKVTLLLKPRGASQLILKTKLNKIDLGIGARHAVTALRNDGHEVISVIPKTDGKQFSIEILYQ